MSIKDKAVGFTKKFKLDSHHAIERFGVFFGVLAVTGMFVLGGSVASAWENGRATLTETALYTDSFTTSKTKLEGKVEGVYRNELGNKTLVMMNFGETSKISYNAEDYEAFLLGSRTDLKTEKVSTSGIKGTFHVFGSTGYMGVILEADQPFDRQVLNLTMRANAELSFKDEQASGGDADALAGDASFAKHDQWRVFFNPGASGAKHIEALDTAVFDPARAYYDIVLKGDEAKVRDTLDSKLVEMRADLNKIKAYSSDLQTTKVDGLFLRPPTVPEAIREDTITGMTKDEVPSSANAQTRAEAGLTLNTDHTVPRGLDFDWRAGNVYDGYLNKLVPSGGSYAKFLADKNTEPQDDVGADISNLPWLLSDGTDLKKDYTASDVTVRPLTNVMNNLSQAYRDYYTHKTEYQTDLLFQLLDLDVELRNVQSNSSIREDADFLVTLY